MMLSENSLLLPTKMRVLLRLSRVVANRPISLTSPLTPAAVITSPTLNGRRTTRNTPAAKLASRPDQAMPIATPAAASRAANEVDSTPNTPRIAMIRTILRTTRRAASMYEVSV
jgi:hypothetical protein